MKRILLILCVCFLLCKTSSAFHIKGGWIQYKYLSKVSDTSSQYLITLHVYRICGFPGTLPMPTRLAIYDAVTNVEARGITINDNQYVITPDTRKTERPPCANVSNTDMPCYAIYTFTTIVELKDNPNGYIFAASDWSRASTLMNVNSGGTGITFTSTLAGNTANYHINSNPEFAFKDTALICFNAKFSYSFVATDAENDSLSFSFGDALNGASGIPTKPPYSPMNYKPAYSGLLPLGPDVTIDPQTGTISGIAPAIPGVYVIAVYVHEWRNGVRISSTKKEMEIGIGNCSLSPVELKKVYLNCNNYTISLQNETVAANITSYLWDFGVPNSTTDVSTSPTPTYTYTDAGTYTVKLKVANNQGCADSTTAEAKIYPGFTPLFAVDGSCFENAIIFRDTSIVKHGSVSSWAWNFGDPSTTNDIANTSTASYKYPAPTQTSVMMSITATTGCAGTITKTVTIYDKPVISLAFTDTLICSIDTLSLSAQISRGSFAWTPNYRISNTQSLQPRVDPKDTTVYTLTVMDNGCIDSAKVTVNVLDFITVDIKADTGICQTDAIILNPVSHALSYRWAESPNAGSLNDLQAKYPVARPLVTTTYTVIGNLGYCQDTAAITVNVSPYPVAQLGADTVLCFGHRMQIPAIFVGSSFSWNPARELLQGNTLAPFAAPSKNSSFIFTARDVLYCPKEVSDTIQIRVIPAFNVFAGRDTFAGINQPLQLSATGADPSYNYTWTPALYLDNSRIANPIATVTDASYDMIEYRVKATTPEGCSATDEVRIKIYNKGPEIYIPSAFTPNNDGRNDVLKPTLIGISKLVSFTIYNRWGQVVFNTLQHDKGWDGSLNGIMQPAGTYVYVAEGKDYNGKTIIKKGSLVLIK